MKNKIEHCFIFLKWFAIAILTGVVLGIVGTAFHFAVEWATELRMHNMFIIAFLFAGGLVIAFLYHITHMEKDKGTNMVLESVDHTDITPPLWQAPLIFISTVITHLFGGSVGREGAALQLGGSIGNGIGRLLHLEKNDSGVASMCGMSASFSALFGTPITAAVFSMEVTSVGFMHYAAIVPCVVAAVVGDKVASLFGIEPTAFAVMGIPEISVLTIVKVGILGIMCALVGTIFCETMHKTHKLYEKYLPNAYLRIAVGGIIVSALTFIIGTGDYNGAGMDVIARAISGDAVIWAFALKIIFTALTMGAGYKGGEIVPTLFIGATFGAVFAPALGLDPSFGGAAAMAALFCGVTNCPLSSILISIELFGVSGMPLYAIAVAVSYMLSGNGGLYSSQRVIGSKYKSQYID